MDTDAFFLPKEARRIVMLPPFARGRLGPVHFRPTAKSGPIQVRSWLFVRNNLTVLDDVLLLGEGGAARIELDEGGEPATQARFAIAERQLLRLCRAPKPPLVNGVDQPNWVILPHASPEPINIIKVERTLRFVNRGNLPFNISDVGLNRLNDCSEAGFVLHEMRYRAAQRLTSRECGSRSRFFDVSGQSGEEQAHVMVGPGEAVELYISFEPDFR